MASPNRHCSSKLRACFFMKINSIDVYRVAMPLVYPFRTAFGNDDCIESVLVRMESKDGYGWGEAAPWHGPAYSPEFAAGASLVIADFLAPLLLGREMGSGSELQEKLSGVKGNHFAKS